MSQSLSDLEKKLLDLELRFAEIEKLNQFLARQAKEYFLLFDSLRKLNNSNGIKSFYHALDGILRKNFGVDEYGLIIKNEKSEILSIRHSFGLPKRELKEIFYRPAQGMVGKVFTNKRAVYIPDTSKIKEMTYFHLTKNLKGCLYYLPILDRKEDCFGVLKMRKIIKDSFSEVQRAVLPRLQSEIGGTFLNAQKVEMLNSKCYLDEETGLYNRRFFNEHFSIEFKRAQRYQHDFSVLFVGIDDPKKVWNTFKRAGIEHLYEILGTLLRRVTRSSDFCIRYGPDEFIILLPETPPPAARDVANKLKKTIQEHDFSLNGEFTSSHITLSIGISSYPRDTIEPKLLFELAQKAFYQAQKKGKNQTVMAENL